MPTTESNLLISPSLTEAVCTNADSEIPSSQGYISEGANRSAWNEVIDYKLNEWSQNTEQFNDEGVEPPTPETVERAIKFAEELRDAGHAAPDSVVLDVNGGIVFERRENDVSEVFYVWDDGEIEYQRFHGTRLIKRRPL